MSEPHFTFEFEGISDNLQQGRLWITDHVEGYQTTIRVWIDDKDLLHLRGRQLNPQIADLIDIAIAISEADRWSQRHEDFPCQIRVRLPVRNVDLLNDPELHKLLTKMMYWFTGDIWSFDFLVLDGKRRFAELQLPLWESSNRGMNAEVALWSGGLDAMAGLCNRIEKQSADRYLLFGAGGNASMRGVQKDVYRRLKKRLDIDMHLMQLHIFQRNTQNTGLRPDKRLRARGVVFMLLGSAYALLEGQKALSVYENGTGAINLPFRYSEVGLDHARSVHPLSLEMLSKVVGFISGEKFSVHNPFLWSTKGEMCAILNKINVTDIAWETVSCDRPYRSNVSQCGRCSSCLLRRQSYLASSTEDRTPYRIHVDTASDLDKLLSKSQLPHMMLQANMLQRVTSEDDAWVVLARKYPTRLADMVYRLGIDNRQRKSLINQGISLFKRYSNEWLLPAVSQVFQSEYDYVIQAVGRVKQQEKASREGIAQ